MSFAARRNTAENAFALSSFTSVREIAAAQAIHSVYQPIVHMATGNVVGYEALARGPAATPFEHPAVLFNAAREEGVTDRVDWACRAAALRGALDHGLGPPFTLFLNVEPAALAAPTPEALRPLMREALGRLNIMIEITERALTARPAEMLNRVAYLRGLGSGIAIDDVGADPASLALLPFLEPEVIKLDLRLVQENTTDEIARIISAVYAESERTGAVVLAEGIETHEQAELAMSFGAEFGQGWHFGHPGPLPSAYPQHGPALPRAHGNSLLQRKTTPFDIVAGNRKTKRVALNQLQNMTDQIEAEALAQGESAVVLASFHKLRGFNPAVGRRYQRLAQSATFVGALGVGMPLEPAPGVRGGDLAGAGRLREEWNIAVIGPHFAAAFVARDAFTPDAPSFDFALTYDRNLAVKAAAAMMAMIPSRD